MSQGAPLLEVYMDQVALGDALFYTPLINATPCRLNIQDCDVNRRLEPLFHGLCETRFVQGDRATSKDVGPERTHRTRQMLDFYGLSKYSRVPRIKLLPEELREAWQIVRQFRNPIAIRDLARQPHRSMSKDLTRMIVAMNRDSTFLNFGLSGPVYHGQSTDLPPQVVRIDDLPIRIMAACYYHIGRYVGCDTGNPHLMLAVGGKCDVFIPENGVGGYNWQTHLYPSDTFQNDEKRMIYMRINCPGESIVGMRYF